MNVEELHKRVDEALYRKEIKNTQNIKSVVLTKEIKELSTKKTINEFRSLLERYKPLKSAAAIPLPFGDFSAITPPVSSHFGIFSTRAEEPINPKKSRQKKKQLFLTISHY